MNYSNLLFIGFLMKLLSRKNIFSPIKEKEGIATLRLYRKFEKCTFKMDKVNLDLEFLLKYKKEKLIPTFAKPKLSIVVDKKTSWNNVSNNNII